MNTQKPPLQKFKEKIEAVFEQSLTSAASLAAEDLWRNWSAIFEEISNNSIIIKTDTLFLSRNFPEYGKYHIWKGLALISFFAGIVLLFFYWQAGVIIMVIGVCSNFHSRFKKVTAGKKFTEDLRKEIIQNPLSMGMAKLCAHYIAGIIQLSSAKGKAHWRQYPSNVITGEIEFIPTNKKH